MTENNHEVLKSRMTGPEPLILYFSAEPCTVCHAMLPKLQKALLEMGEAQEGRITT
jgi:thiol-disulfide isomerase/thioredoxin